MPQIIIRTEGFERVFAVLDRLENPQWDELLRLIGSTVEDQSRNHFQEQAGPEGAWEPRKSGGNWAILIKSGELRRSITHEVRPPDAVEMGVPPHTFYGQYHQEGRPPRLARRMFLGLTETDKDQLQQVVENYLESLMQ